MLYLRTTFLSINGQFALFPSRDLFFAEHLVNTFKLNLFFLQEILALCQLSLQRLLLKGHDLKPSFQVVEFDLLSENFIFFFSEIHIGFLLFLELIYTSLNLRENALLANCSLKSAEILIASLFI